MRAFSQSRSNKNYVLSSKNCYFRSRTKLISVVFGKKQGFIPVTLPWWKQKYEGVDRCEEIFANDEWVFGCEASGKRSFWKFLNSDSQILFIFTPYPLQKHTFHINVTLLLQSSIGNRRDCALVNMHWTRVCVSNKIVEALFKILINESKATICLKLNFFLCALLLIQCKLYFEMNMVKAVWEAMEIVRAFFELVCRVNLNDLNKLQITRLLHKFL